MSDLQDAIVATSIKAYNQGIRTDREQVIKLLEEVIALLKEDTL